MIFERQRIGHKVMRALYGLLLALMPIGAFAQNTAEPVIPGYLSTAGCPSTSPCFIPYGPGLPTKPSPLTALASTQTLTLTTSAQPLTVPQGATSATWSVTGGSAVYRDDGTAPTATVGLTLPTGVWGYAGPLGAVQFILPSGVTGTVVTVAYYK